MTTIEICLASIQRELPVISTAEANSNHPIANLYNTWNATTGLFTEPKELKSIDFRNNFFLSGFFSLLRTDDNIAKLDNWYIESAEHDALTNKTDPPFNLYNHVLERWHTEVPLNTWDVASQIFIRRDLWHLNKLKNWYLDHASYTWRELLKVFDQKEENDIQEGALDNTPNALNESIDQNVVSAQDGTYNDLIPTTDGSGINAKLRVVISGGEVTSVAATTRGSGYSAGDTITIPSANIGNGGNLIIILQDKDVAKFPITTRQDSNALKFNDHPIISLAYTNSNAALTPIIVKLHFKIVNDDI